MWPPLMLNNDLSQMNFKFVEGVDYMHEGDANRRACSLHLSLMDRGG